MGWYSCILASEAEIQASRKLLERVIELVKRYDKPSRLLRYPPPPQEVNYLRQNLRFPHLHGRRRNHPGAGDELPLLQPHAGDPQCRTEPNLLRQPGGGAQFDRACPVGADATYCCLNRCRYSVITASHRRGRTCRHRRGSQAGG